MKLKAITSGAILLAVPICAAAQTSGADDGRTPQRFAGTYVTASIIDTITSPAGTFDCQFLASLGEVGSCTSNSIIQIDSDGTIAGASSLVQGFNISESYGEWFLQERRTISARTIQISTNTENLEERFIVADITLVFEGGRQTFQGTVVLTGFPIGVNPLEETVDPFFVQTGSISGTRF